MEFFLAIALSVLFLIIFSICGWCCKRKREGTVYGYGNNVTVSSQPISASPVVIPPYPIDARHPTPHAGAPAPGFAPQNYQPYPTHPGHPGMPTPYGVGPLYPPTGGENYAQPPPYDVAVSLPPLQPAASLAHEGYGKQAPYNPHYGGR